MQAGQLDRRLTIKQRVTGQDSIGQPMTTWQTVATVWGSVKYLSGLAAIKADAETSIAKASIRIRFRTGLDAGMRVELGAEVFAISDILPFGRNEFLDLVVVRVQ